LAAEREGAAPLSRSPIRKVRLPALLLGTAILASTGLVLAATPQTVWLDAPLDGSTAEVGDSVRIVGHVTDPSGVSFARVDVNGERLERVNLDSGPGDLVTVEFLWEPTEPGTYVISLLARGNADGWRGPANATVTVTGEPEPPTTSTSTSTTTTTSTTSSTTTTPTTTPPCEFAAPDPAAPADGSTTPLVANTLSWTYSGCRPALEYEVEVSSTPAFLEIFASAIVDTTDWLTPNLACDTYWWRVRPTTFDDVGPWSTPWSYTIMNRGC
jgi:hypothetical protein